MKTDQQQNLSPTAAIPVDELALIPPDQMRRLFDYERRLIPNRFVAETDSESADLASAVRRTGLSIGYPAWNLLYFSLLCSLKRKGPVVIETGTNLGYSTIMMAQALKDAHSQGIVFTVDIDPEAARRAEENAARAEVREFIDFSVNDSVEFLKRMMERHDRVDFAFLDGGHSAARVIAEFEVIYGALKAGGGTAYFDNSSAGGVADALTAIRARFGGNLIRFENCSWAPPGAALWQA